MANFELEKKGNFGVPGVEIEPTLSSVYDPYSGIDLTGIQSVIDRNLEVSKYYWELLLELFQYFDFEDVHNSVSPAQCKLYFNNRYGLNYDSSKILCNQLIVLGDMTDWILNPAGIIMGVTGDVDSQWNHALNLAGLCDESNPPCQSGDGIPYSVSNPPTLEDGVIELVENENGRLFQYSDYAVFNTDNYWNLDKDGRPSLGLFFPKDINISSDNFTDNIPDLLFTQIPKTNLLNNSECRFLEQSTYFGTNWVKPAGGWNYVSLDGIGVNLSQGNKPTSDYVEGFLDGGAFNDDEEGFGYSGYYPYMLATNEEKPDLDGDGLADEVASLAQDYQWARWIESTACKSWDKCLLFYADDDWNDTIAMTDQEITPVQWYRSWAYGYDSDTDPSNSNQSCEDTSSYAGEGLTIALARSAARSACNAGSDTGCVCTTDDTGWEGFIQNQYTDSQDNRFRRVMRMTNNHEYRTINQFQKFYNQGDTRLNPLNPLKVSFEMKTTNSNYDSSNPPYVEAGVVGGAIVNRGDIDVNIDPSVLAGFVVETELTEFPGCYGDCANIGLGNSTNQSIVVYYDPDTDDNLDGWDNYHNYGSIDNISMMPFGDGTDTWDGGMEGWYLRIGPHYSSGEFEIIKIINNYVWTGATDVLYQGGYSGNAFAVILEVERGQNVTGDGIVMPSQSWWDGNGNHTGTKVEIWASEPDPLLGIEGGQGELVATTTTHNNVDYYAGQTPNSTSTIGLWDHNNVNIYIGRENNSWTFRSEGSTTNQGQNLDYYRNFVDNAIFKDTADGTNQLLTVATPNGPGYFDSQDRDYYLKVGTEIMKIQVHATVAQYDEAYDWEIYHSSYSSDSSYWTDGYNTRNIPPMNRFQVERGSLGTIAYPHVPGENVELWYGPPISILEQNYDSLETVETFWNTDYLVQRGGHNSTLSSESNQYSKFGGLKRFKNTQLNIWEKKEFTFNLDTHHTNPSDPINVKDLSFLIQASSNTGQPFRGQVILDNFEVYESHDFMPDVDVRKKKGPSEYGIADLTKYYDKQLEPEKYKDTTAPLEAQFYFYPRYNYDNFLDKDGGTQILYNDFREGMFYLYNVNWGDGTPNEFVSEPELLGEDISVFHTYEKDGIFEITGTMIKMKPDKDYNPMGIIHHKKFNLKININVGYDEDFNYFSDYGFSFIPYVNTLPIIGGISKQSIYYKSTKRQLGILDDVDKINTQFKHESDRFKVERAMDKMDSSYNHDFDLLNEFKLPRKDGYWLPDLGSYDTGTEQTTGILNIEDIIYDGESTKSEELGKSIGDVDFTDIRYFNKPKQIWEMLGFSSLEDGYLGPNILNPDDEERGVSYSANWDDSYHPNAINTDGWTAGYNPHDGTGAEGGIHHPEWGHHAFWTDTETIQELYPDFPGCFGDYCLMQQDKNDQYNYCIDLNEFVPDETLITYLYDSSTTNKNLVEDWNHNVTGIAINGYTQEECEAAGNFWKKLEGRWLGTHSDSGKILPSYDFDDINISVGDQLEISWYQMVTHIDKAGRVGLYHISKDDASYGWGTGNYTIDDFYNTETYEWQRHTFTITIDDNWIMNSEDAETYGSGLQNPKIYLYGTAGIHNETIWFDNIQLRKVEITSEEVVEMGYDNLQELLDEFDSVHPGNPDATKYWKNIIPENYDILNRTGLENTDMLREDYEFPWNSETFHVSIHQRDPGGLGRFAQIDETTGLSEQCPTGNSTCWVCASNPYGSGGTAVASFNPTACCKSRWHKGDFEYYYSRYEDGGTCLRYNENNVCIEYENWPTSYQTHGINPDGYPYQPGESYYVSWKSNTTGVGPNHESIPYFTGPPWNILNVGEVTNDYWTDYLVSNGYDGTTFGKKYGIVCNRDAIIPTHLDTFKSQTWLDGYYYPVLPKYGQDGLFRENHYPNGNQPFPQEAPITNENYSSSDLKISIGSKIVDTNVYDDNSGNNNYGFIFSDYRPDFDTETLEPKKTKKMSLSKTSKSRRPY